MGPLPTNRSSSSTLLRTPGSVSLADSERAKKPNLTAPPPSSAVSPSSVPSLSWATSSTPKRPASPPKKLPELMPTHQPPMRTCNQLVKCEEPILSECFYVFTFLEKKKSH